MGAAYGGNVLPLYDDGSGHTALIHMEWTLANGILIPKPTTASGNPEVALTGSNTLYDGQVSVTTAGTALPDQAGVEISLQADPSNTANILVGSASSQHTVLQPGQSMALSLANLNLIYAVAESGTQLLNWLVRR